MDRSPPPNLLSLSGFLTVSLALVALAAGCYPAAPSKSGGAAGRPTFTLVWSEYPAWTAFAVAHDEGLIDNREGQLSKLEEKWKVDVVVKQMPYDKALSEYQSGHCDAVCTTNLDALQPALNRRTVAILPTSTSNGGDACIVVGNTNSIKDLRGQKIYGMKEGLSHHGLSPYLEKAGEKEDDYSFTQFEPDVAAAFLQSKVPEVRAIMVWNPMVIQTLKARADARVLFDSSEIPEEVIDLVVVGQDSLDRPGGKEFAGCILETFYELNKMLAEKGREEKLLAAMGQKFAQFSPADMKQALKQSPMYPTPDEGVKLFTGPKLAGTMKTTRRRGRRSRSPARRSGRTGSTSGWSCGGDPG